jgi:hypothetical protein
MLYIFKCISSLACNSNRFAAYNFQHLPHYILDTTHAGPPLNGFGESDTQLAYLPDLIHSWDTPGKISAIENFTY